jgi:hypothetical protein
MKSITEIFNNSNDLLDSISIFVEKYIGAELLRKCNITKIVDNVQERSTYDYCNNPILRLIGDIKESRFLQKCISATQLLIDKLLLCFMMSSAYQMFKIGTYYGNYKKDTFYRFDRLPKANWERLQLETARNLILDIESQTDDKHKCALIFDDSMYQRIRGKGTELCGMVYDHVDHKKRLGYRMMTGTWTNGVTNIPFAQTLLTTRNKDLMIGPNNIVDRRTISGKRKARAKEKGTDTVLRMVKDAIDAGIPFDFVLFDTWFSNPAQLIDLKGIGADVIAMVKKNSTRYFVMNPETGSVEYQNIKEIYNRSKKLSEGSKYLLSVKAVATNRKGESIPVKLVYARNHSNKKDWVCFICTDMSLTEEEVLRYYTFRWKIELYFRMAKSYLKLRTECHSPSYDAITSHMVIVSLRYMILEHARFQNSDNRTIEDLFYQVQREVVNSIMDTAIVIIVDALLNAVRKCFNVTEEQMDQLLIEFVNELPAPWKTRFQLPASA